MSAESPVWPVVPHFRPRPSCESDITREICVVCKSAAVAARPDRRCVLAIIYHVRRSVWNALKCLALFFLHVVFMSFSQPHSFITPTASCGQLWWVQKAPRYRIDCAYGRHRGVHLGHGFLSYSFLYSFFICFCCRQKKSERTLAQRKCVVVLFVRYNQCSFKAMTGPGQSAVYPSAARLLL